jgi:antimicrobial peptide system SdpB family protein
MQKLIYSLYTMAPWTNVYGLARSLLALATALTLMFNNTDILFRPSLGTEECPVCIGIVNISIYCIFKDNLPLAKIISIVILLVVASGWRPKFMAIPHWYITFSLFSSAILCDGGDQVASVITLLMIPACLCDNRQWHWQPTQRFTKIQALIANTSFIVIRIQVAVIYLNAAVAKFKVDEWTNGTALYYWLADPLIGLPNHFRNPILFLLKNPYIVSVFTWSVLMLELMLFAALLLKKEQWKYLLTIGLTFHFAILLFHGLISFFLSMAAVIILYLRPLENEFKVINTIFSSIQRHTLQKKYANI